MPQLPTTQRAYTLRLRGADKTDTTWRDVLWATHEAVNKGAKVFGDWLLTLRGGLSHELADEKVKGGKGKPDRRPTTEERRDRRILLALSWLSVESAPNESDPHKALVIASGKDDSQSSRDEKVLDAYRKILGKRGVRGADLESWIADCDASLMAAIREDAVWVNRSAAFDGAQDRVGRSLTREGVWDMLGPFFGSADAYLAPLKTADDSESQSIAAEDKAKDLVQKAGQWLSSRFGTGKGSDFSRMSKVYAAVAAWAEAKKTYQSGPAALASLARSLSAFRPPPSGADGILDLISGPGYKSATQNVVKAWANRDSTMTAEDVSKFGEIAANDREKCRSKTGAKGHRPWSDSILAEVESACNFTYLQADGPARHCEFSVMLDHAARRVSIAHSWIKRAESERQKFQEDAKRLQSVPADARAWLDQFCEQRSGTSAALDAYRIRKRAVEGWKEVIARWGRKTCTTDEDRVAAARDVQGDPDIDKFGDIQLFEALAEDEALCVWRVNGEATPQPLIDYAAATDAQAKQKRFKVPAYRHPDPLAHPVFCDFGYSRWDIRFAVHDAVSKSESARQAVARREEALIKATRRLAKASTKEQRITAEERIRRAQEAQDDAQRHLAWLGTRRALGLGLWTGQRIDRGIPLLWSCKRLTKDLALRESHAETSSAKASRALVTRADRLGRAVLAVPEDAAVGILGLFDDEHWNGRLQAPRAQLDAIARRVAKHGWDAKAQRMRERLRWLVSFSAKLLPAGSWIKFANDWETDCGVPFPLHPKREANGKLRGRTRLLSWEWSAADSDYVVELGSSSKPDSRGSAYPFINPTDLADRSGHAKLILARLRGLRLLSVDLGHRYAAACAVWEVLTIQEMKSECKAAGHLPPAESDLFLHLTTTNADHRPRTTVYRRIASDRMPDGTTHPAPWARLERQFLVKLQGEDHPARAASKGAGGEIDRVDRFAEWLGLASDDDREKGRAVDQLMARAVRLATLGLKRHARRAKIAYALDPKTKAAPGMGGTEKMFDVGDDAHIKLLTDALFDWHALASDSRWDDKSARDLWNIHIAGLPNAGKIRPPKDTAADDERTRAERRLHEDALRERLRPIAEHLVSATRAGMYQAWKQRWEQDDGTERDKTDFQHRVTKDEKGNKRSTTTAKRDTSGWHAELRWLTDWIMGWHVRRDRRCGSMQNVGGLSLTRIVTMKSLYQLHKAFAMRARPDKPRGAPEKGESNVGVAQSILDAMERMREQRVKQLASRIAASALGLGGHWKEVEVPKRDERGALLRKSDGSAETKKKWVWVEEPEPKYAPCHAVVIENLTKYRPEETRTRRENRQLMSWSSSKVKKYLSEACQLHGLHLREVQAGYTSRQDSRTGAPGIRCRDFPVTDFVTQNGFLWRHVKRSVDKTEEGSSDQEHLYIRDLLSNWNAEQRTWTDAAGDLWVLGKDGRWLGRDGQPQGKQGYKSPAPVRLPWKGGELFVSAEPGRHEAVALQADLNAAANIGLKALLDPDWPGGWWYVPAELNDDGWRVPASRSCAGAVWVSHWKVAQVSNGCYSPRGSPLQLTDDEGVKHAEEAAKQAKGALDDADKALKAAKTTKLASEIDAATTRRQQAKEGHDAAKKALAEAKKGATPKEVINLWRDPMSAPAADFASGGAWRVYDGYKLDVQKRVIQLLREQAGLPRE